MSATFYIRRRQEAERQAKLKAEAETKANKKPKVKNKPKTKDTKSPLKSTDKDTLDLDINILDE